MAPMGHHGGIHLGLIIPTHGLESFRIQQITLVTFSRRL